MMQLKPCYRGLNQPYGIAGLQPWDLALLLLCFFAWVRCFGHPLRGAVLVLFAVKGLQEQRRRRLPGTMQALATYWLQGATFSAIGTDPQRPYREFLDR